MPVTEFSSRTLSWWISGLFCDGLKLFTVNFLWCMSCPIIYWLLVTGHCLLVTDCLFIRNFWAKSGGTKNDTICKWQNDKAKFPNDCRVCIGREARERSFSTVLPAIARQSHVSRTEMHAMNRCKLVINLTIRGSTRNSQIFNTSLNRLPEYELLSSSIVLQKIASCMTSFVKNDLVIPLPLSEKNSVSECIFTCSETSIWSPVHITSIKFLSRFQLMLQKWNYRDLIATSKLACVTI